jgi:hypothetical protein
LYSKDSATTRGIPIRGKKVIIVRLPPNNDSNFLVVLLGSFSDLAAFKYTLETRGSQGEEE